MKRYWLGLMYTDPESGERLPAVEPYRGPPTAPTLNPRHWSRDIDDVVFGQIGFDSAILPQLQAEPNIRVLFDDVPLGVEWASVPLPRRVEIKAAVQALGLTFTVQGQWSFKMVLQHIVDQIQPGIDIEVGDVQDLWG